MWVKYITQDVNNMQEIERLINGEWNPEFGDILDKGKRMNRSPFLSCSGLYDGCLLYKGAVYERWINWGYDRLFRLDESDRNATHQDREGRVGETYKVDRCQQGDDIIKATPAPVVEQVERKHSDGWGCWSIDSEETENMTARETLEVYTQEEFETACQACYDQGREDGYDSALNSVYADGR